MKTSIISTASTYVGRDITMEPPCCVTKNADGKARVRVTLNAISFGVCSRLDRALDFSIYIYICLFSPLSIVPSFRESSSALEARAPRAKYVLHLADTKKKRATRIDVYFTP